MISLSPVLIGSSKFAHANNETLPASNDTPSSYPGSLKTVVLEVSYFLIIIHIVSTGIKLCLSILVESDRR